MVLFCNFFIFQFLEYTDKRPYLENYQHIKIKGKYTCIGYIKGKLSENGLKICISTSKTSWPQFTSKLKKLKNGKMPNKNNLDKIVTMIQH